MTTPNMLPKPTPELLSSGKRSESIDGAQAVFIPISATAGIKLFRNRAERNHAEVWQKILGPLGITPLCGESFDLTEEEAVKIGGSYSRNRRWGLVVERVIVNGDRGWEAAYRSSYRTEEHDRLKLACDEAGFWWDDDHDGNYGYKNGKMVVIDMGWLNGNTPMFVQGLA